MLGAWAIKHAMTEAVIWPAQPIESEELPAGLAHARRAADRTCDSDHELGEHP